MEVLTLFVRLSLILLSTVAIGQTKSNGRNNGWPEYGGMLAGDRYSSETSINKANVAGLEPAWTFHTHTLDSAYSVNKNATFEATPVLWNGTLYFDTSFGEIFALDVAT